MMMTTTTLARTSRLLSRPLFSLSFASPAASYLLQRLLRIQIANAEWKTIQVKSNRHFCSLVVRCCTKRQPTTANASVSFCHRNRGKQSSSSSHIITRSRSAPTRLDPIPTLFLPHHPIPSTRISSHLNSHLASSTDPPPSLRSSSGIRFGVRLRLRLLSYFFGSSTARRFFSSWKSHTQTLLEDMR